jgi:hypothetical protein
MQNRKISVVVSVGGMTMPLGTFKIATFAGKYNYTSATTLVCPSCKEKPDSVPQYHCPRCNKDYTSWAKLLRVDKVTGEPVVKDVLHDSKDPPQANLYKLPIADFQSRYSDATAEDKGIEPADAMSAMNLQNLIVATERLNYVIVLKWTEKYQENVAILTLSPSNRVVLKEVIPRPIAQLKPTKTVDMESITEQQITLARQLIDQIPEVTDEVMTVEDFRTYGLDEEAITVTEPVPVQDLAAILQQMQEAEQVAKA